MWSDIRKQYKRSLRESMARALTLSFCSIVFNIAVAIVIILSRAYVVIFVVLPNDNFPLSSQLIRVIECDVHCPLV